MTSILVVDDDPAILKSVRLILEDQGHEITGVDSGVKALDLLTQQNFDALILDVIMPELTGIEVCRRIRANPLTATLPILFLTAKGRPDDIAQGLDAGGDDYLIKPIQVVELPARIRALLRRGPEGSLSPLQDYLEIGNLRFYRDRFELDIEGREIALTPTEHRLLHYLILNQGHPVTTDQLLEEVWEYPPGVGDPRLVRVHITNLRSKLGSAPSGSTPAIQNIHGSGYLIVP